MQERTLGIHHITAISGAPHQNYDFYTRVLELKMVKKTVNFDDPGTYHLYYGDRIGSPGSLLTFFPYEGRAGKPGPGQVTTTVYAAPKGQLDRWEARLQAEGVEVKRQQQFGKDVLQFVDPHGMGLEIVEADGIEWGIFAGAGLSLVNPEKTQQLLEFLGYQVIGKERGRTRMAVPGSRDYLDLIKVPAAATDGGPGTVHHIALRLPDDASQQRWRDALLARGYQVSPITDRNYFHSIYFRGPEGVLYELATDPPGMLIDESEEDLGKTLRLPPQYEKYRKQLENYLAPLDSAFHTHEEAGRGEVTLVGLHGTGGNELDLVPLLHKLDAHAPVLSLRGNVDEGGQLRFFRRLAEGVFDQHDLAQRSRELARFLSARSDARILVGYSNGANIGAHTLMHHPESAQAAVLFRPMLGWTPPTDIDLSGKHILLLIGDRDPVVSPQRGLELAEAFRKLGAQVQLEQVQAGHELTAPDIQLAQKWLQDKLTATSR